MENLAAAFINLERAQRRQVHIQLCHSALDVWEAYMQRQPPLTYVDSVVGMHHVVDALLPRDALLSVVTGTDQSAVARRYLEPIAALQDDDLTLPTEIEFAYYAIYNLYRNYVEGAAINSWLIVNQALAAVEPSRQRAVLAQAIHAVRAAQVWR
jgi:hypothetical protein